jgi:hypothetical protein
MPCGQDSGFRRRLPSGRREPVVNEKNILK